MENIYLILVFVLFCFAIFDLIVGVSNDAVNFLNSAVGSKAGKFKTIILISALGVLLGATMSNGMMEIARHGIFHPQYFNMKEIICLMLAVMVTDVVLLDMFNSFGMPTSTTVSLVFELLGGAVALAAFKAVSIADVSFMQMINTDKALQVIIGIFLSIAIAFIIGAIVQWLARLLFSFNYNKNMKWFIGLFAGLCVTGIIYFIFIKGLKSATFMTENIKDYISLHTVRLVVICFMVSSTIMQILYWIKINVFKVIVLLGTFALAMAFAGNDLVNFIGVPLAGFSAYQDYMQFGTKIGMDAYNMGHLNNPVSTPIYFLIIAGIVMVISLMTSKKARKVIKTSVDLSRQNYGDEMFGTSRLARSIVRSSTHFSEWLVKVTPIRTRRWIDARFNRNEVILENGAAFDSIRASVNLVIASLLVALGTSLKLPLSTTFVTFMVAMGTSLSDRAWGKESAVFRITGVISVIGGWFLTAGIAFVLCFLVTTAMHFGGIPVMLILAISAFLIILRSNIRYAKKVKEKKGDQIFQAILKTDNEIKVWELLKEHVRETASMRLYIVSKCYFMITDGLINSDRKELHKVAKLLDEENIKFKKNRRIELVSLRKTSTIVSLKAGTWYNLTSNNISQIVSSLRRICEPITEHVDNTFNSLPKECIEEFISLRDELYHLMEDISKMIKYGNFDKEAPAITNRLIILKNKYILISEKHLNRIQLTQEDDLINIYILYQNILQEAVQQALILERMVDTSKKFFQD
ncbi:MAG: inorganic phosphate transporter [Bacteroidales bacterium]